MYEILKEQIIFIKSRVGEMTQGLRALVLLPENLDLIPRTHGRSQAPAALDHGGVKPSGLHRYQALKR